MTLALDILQMLGTFLVGMAGRAGLFLLAGIALATPALVIALGWRFVAGRGLPDLLVHVGLTVTLDFQVIAVGEDLGPASGAAFGGRDIAIVDGHTDITEVSAR